jgi:hypothetical protein
MRRRPLPPSADPADNSCLDGVEGCATRLFVGGNAVISLIQIVD